MVVEIMNWSLLAAAAQAAPEPVPEVAGRGAPRAHDTRRIHVEGEAHAIEVPCYSRDSLETGDRIRGPAVVSEAQTTTYVAPGFDAVVDGGLNIVLARVPPEAAIP